MFDTRTVDHGSSVRWTVRWYLAAILIQVIIIYSAERVIFYPVVLENEKSPGNKNKLNLKDI